MMLPLQITFRNLEPTPAIRGAVRRRSNSLERCHPRITGCRVMIEAPHRRHRQGNLFRVRVDVTVPRGEIVAGRDPREHGAHEDLYVAIRDAFRAAERRLREQARRRHGRAKVHVGVQTATVARVDAEGGFGFLLTADDREIFFHRNSVASGFERLEPGMRVRFSEEQGEKGPQASRVVLPPRLLGPRKEPNRSRSAA